MTEVGHFLQSAAWERFEDALGNPTRSGAGDGWHWRAAIETGRLSTRAYAPYGPVAESAGALDGALAALERDARGRSDFVRVEPTGLPPDEARRVLEERGYRHTNPVQPENTWVLDLGIGEDALIAGMQASNRNRHRNAAKRGLSVRESADPGDIAILLALLAPIAERKGITEHSDAYYTAQADALLPTGDARLFIVEYQDAPVAASFVYDGPTTRYYAHTAADAEHRKLQPGTVLVSTMIIDAARRGLAHFDFVGIAPEDQPDHPWAGFSAFKKSFGGHPVHYVGTWEKPVNKTKYALYRAARRLLD